MKLRMIKVAFFLCAAFSSFAANSASGSVTAKITDVMAGADGWYGVRFYLKVTSNNAVNICKAEFAYTEPEPSSGHRNIVHVFSMAYMLGKTVHMVVVPGREGYCKIIEGRTVGEL